MDGLRENLLALVGTPYGDPRFAPADCWGFVRHCYSLIDIELPEDIWSARNICERVSEDNIRLLDVIYMRDFLLEQRHIGVALDGLYLLQSSKSTNGVAAVRLNRPGVRESIEAVYRLK